MNSGTGWIHRIMHGLLNGIGRWAASYFDPPEESYERGAGTIMDCMWRPGRGQSAGKKHPG